MTKNTKGGKGFKKGKKNRGDDSEVSTKALILKQDGEEYATVTKLLGNCRLNCACHDGTERIGIIRGRLVKRVWITTGDIVLVSIRDFQDNKCDVIHKYNSNEVKELIKNKYIINIKPLTENKEDPNNNIEVGDDIPEEGVVFDDDAGDINVEDI
jgi:translation initiation factor 1A